jgi:hypothetical protein
VRALVVAGLPFPINISEGVGGGRAALPHKHQ